MRNQAPTLRRGALAIAVALAACAPGDPTPGGQQESALPEGHPDISGMTAPVAGGVAGTVQEALNGGGYTYARLDLGGREIWVAGPQTTLAVGEQVSLPDTMPMLDFTVKSLSRTFDVLYFTGGFQTETGAAPSSEFQGTVKEVISSGGYTYVNVTAGDQDIWLAAPEGEFEVNTVVAWNGGMRMVDFNSRTLNRTFPEIYFVEEIVTVPGGE